ncbi:MAG: AAA family ATPase [Acholeplasmatales bacterium]|nr:AAA family ATPase [Acholeplasmatales bacterium]
MIKELQVIKYRKLSNINFDFSSGINLISGGNGTCKSSLLYLISNSFSKCLSSNNNLNDKNCIKILSSVTDNWNLKMESLTKDSKVVDDNADLKGTIYTTVYENGFSLNFRKHNSKTPNGKNRFAIKPKYASVIIIYVKLR